MEDISSINNTLHRLVRLNKSLLMLSRIDNRQYTEETTINFNQLIKKVIDDFADFAEFKDVALSFKADTELLFVMNKDLAEILVSNLVKNAIVHNFEGGFVTVKIGTNTLTVSNTATNGALNKDAVFTRFYKGSEAVQSTGLGLAIVQSVADLYKLQLDYQYDDTHNFIVKFS